MIYIYPENLRASASIWIWSARDFLILAVCLLLSAFMLVKLKLFLPMALCMCYGFMTVRMDETRIVDFIRFAFSYFISSQQYFEWRMK